MRGAGSLIRCARSFFLPVIFCCFLGAGGVPAAAETLIVAIGASSTAGRGVSTEDAYPAQLEGMLRAKGRAVRVANAGINGDTSSGMLSRLDRDVPDGARVVILQTGTNDAGDDGHDENIAKVIARLKARAIKIVPLRTSMMRGLRKDFSQPDGHHLTPEGYKILASRLLPLVEQALSP